MKQQKPKFDIGDEVYWTGWTGEVVFAKGIIIGYFYEQYRTDPLYQLKFLKFHDPDKFGIEESNNINRIGIIEENIKLTTLGILKKEKNIMKDETSKTKTSLDSKKTKAGGEAKKKDIKVKSYMKKSGSYYTPFKRTKQKTDSKNLYAKKKI